MTAREEITGVLKGDCDQVDMSAGRLAELIDNVGEQFPELVDLSTRQDADRVLVDSPKLQEVLDALSVYDSRSENVEPVADVREGPEDD